MMHQLVHGKYALRQSRNRRLLVQVKPEEIELVRRDYSANGGWESFLAYEDPRQDILVGLPAALAQSQWGRQGTPA